MRTRSCSRVHDFVEIIRIDWCEERHEGVSMERLHSQFIEIVRLVRRGFSWAWSCALWWFVVKVVVALCVWVVIDHFHLDLVIISYSDSSYGDATTCIEELALGLSTGINWLRKITIGVFRSIRGSFDTTCRILMSPEDHVLSDWALQRLYYLFLLCGSRSQFGNLLWWILNFDHFEGEHWTPSACWSLLFRPQNLDGRTVGHSGRARTSLSPVCGPLPLFWVVDRVTPIASWGWVVVHSVRLSFNSIWKINGSLP